jgi:hypothetical protein
LFKCSAFFTQTENFVYDPRKARDLKLCGTITAQNGIIAAWINGIPPLHCWPPKNAVVYEVVGKNPKGSDDGLQHPDLLGFWILFIVRNSK